MLSYNEENNSQLRLRHLFFPSVYGLAAEAIIAVMALALFNLSVLSDRLLAKNSSDGDPFQLWSRVFKNLLDSGQSHRFVQQALLFGFWAVAGALLYIVIFRAIQFFLGAKQSVDTGVRMVERDHAKGLVGWLTSLHDFFQKVIIIVLGGAALAGGAFICFGIANQEFGDGLAGDFPAFLWPFALSLAGALLSVRFVFLGFSLLSRRFRDWYTT